MDRVLHFDVIIEILRHLPREVRFLAGFVNREFYRAMSALESRHDMLSLDYIDIYDVLEYAIRNAPMGVPSRHPGPAQLTFSRSSPEAKLVLFIIEYFEILIDDVSYGIMIRTGNFALWDAIYGLQSCSSAQIPRQKCDLNRGSIHSEQISKMSGPVHSGFMAFFNMEYSRNFNISLEIGVAAVRNDDTEVLRLMMEYIPKKEYRRILYEAIYDIAQECFKVLTREYGIMQYFNMTSNAVGGRSCSGLTKQFMAAGCIPMISEAYLHGFVFYVDDVLMYARKYDRGDIVIHMTHNHMLTQRGTASRDTMTLGWNLFCEESSLAKLNSIEFIYGDGHFSQ
jgi:hypothetical protein